MSYRSGLLATLSGITGFLVVGVGVTEFTSQWIEFSLFLGLPAGLVAGVGTAAAVYLGLATDAPLRRRRMAGALGAFGVGYLAGLLALAGLVNVPVVLSLVLAFVVGLVSAGVAYYRSQTAPSGGRGGDDGAPRSVN